MMRQTASGALLLAAATLTTAQQYGPPSGSGSGDYNGSPYSSDNNPYTNGGDGSSGSSGSGSNNPYANGSSGFANLQNSIFTQYNGIIAAHAILATLAFGLLFPSGGILIRLFSFPKLWLAHAAVQAFAFLLYIAAFGIGVYMISHAPDFLLHNAHPIIGIVVFVLLVFQPVLGVLHHVLFKKYSRRTVWSYAHLWLGRIVITLGIINGGLGLQLSKRTRVFAPSTGAVVGYAVAAGVMWLLYVWSAVYGERKRSRQGAVNAEVGPPPRYEREREKRDSDSEGSRPRMYA